MTLNVINVETIQTNYLIKPETAAVFDQMNRLGALNEPFFFLINFDLTEAQLFPENEIPSNIYYDINGQKNHEFVPGISGIQPIIRPSPILEYRKAFDTVLSEINKGNSFLLNLTKDIPIHLDQADLRDVFISARAKYKLYYKGLFTVFSPEPFIKIENNTISSFPMKGTINACTPQADRLLLKDPKELAEHCTIVDLIRNDLALVARKVRVHRFRYLEKIYTNHKELWQTSSHIQGDLNADWHERIGTIIQKLLPAGSISGAPKPKTIEIIKHVEDNSRGYYTGVMGFYNGESLDTGVMIRFIEKREDHYYFRTGGGITFQSEVEKEYAELIDKIYVPVYRND